MATKWLSDNEVSRLRIGRAYELDASGNINSIPVGTVIDGAATRVAAALEQMTVYLQSLAVSVASIDRAMSLMVSLLDPAIAAERAKATAVKKKAQRAAESLARAEAAYQRALAGRPVTATATGSLLGKPVADLNLSVRGRKGLAREGITTLGELVQRTVGDLLKIRNLGKASVIEVREKLAAIGLALKDD